MGGLPLKLLRPLHLLTLQLLLPLDLLLKLLLPLLDLLLLLKLLLPLLDPLLLLKLLLLPLQIERRSERGLVPYEHARGERRVDRRFEPQEPAGVTDAGGAGPLRARPLVVQIGE